MALGTSVAAGIILIFLIGYLVFSGGEMSNIQNNLVKLIFFLIIYVITFILVFAEAQGEFEKGMESQGYYKDFYFADEKEENIKFATQACVFLLPVLVIFSLLYGYLIHGKIVKECSNIYSDGDWCIYLNENMDDIIEMQKELGLVQTIEVK